MTYPGGKNGAGVYHAIINQMPPHRVYIEPFLGGGAILLHKRPAHTSWACEWNLEQFAGFTPTLDSDHFGLGVDDDGQRIFRDRDGIPNLFLRHVDALKFLREFSFQGERDHYLVYMDPPYLKEVRSTGAKIYTKDFSTWFEHEELLALAVSLNANVMISGYDHPVYNERLAGWRKIEFTGPTRGGARTECLWMNFAEPVELHDYRYIGENYIVRETIRRQQKRWIKNLEAMPPLQRNALISLIGETFAPSRVAVADDTVINGGAIVAPGQSDIIPAATSTTATIGEAREIDEYGYLGRDHDQHPARGPVPDATAENGDELEATAINNDAAAFFDPRSVSCPTCQAGPGKPCKRPSGHTVFGGGFHATRVPAVTAINDDAGEIRDYRQEALDFAWSYFWSAEDLRKAATMGNPVGWLDATARKESGGGMAYGYRWKHGTYQIWVEREKFGPRRQGKPDLEIKLRDLAIEALLRIAAGELHPHDSIEALVPAKATTAKCVDVGSTIPAGKLKKGDHLVLDGKCIYQSKTPNKNYVLVVWPGSDSGPILKLDKKVWRLPRPTDAWLAQMVELHAGDVNENGIFEDRTTTTVSLYRTKEHFIRVRIAYSEPLKLWAWGYDFRLKDHGGCSAPGLPSKHREYRDVAVTSEKAIEAATNSMRRNGDIAKILDRAPTKTVVRAPKNGKAVAAT